MWPSKAGLTGGSESADLLESGHCRGGLQGSACYGGAAHHLLQHLRRHLHSTPLAHLHCTSTLAASHPFNYLCGCATQRLN